MNWLLGIFLVLNLLTGFVIVFIIAIYKLLWDWRLDELKDRQELLRRRNEEVD